MKKLDVLLDDEYYDYLQKWAVRDHIDLNSWARHALRIKGPTCVFNADTEIEKTREKWKRAVDVALGDGLYGELSELLRKHGFELHSFSTNHLFVEKTRAAYTILFDAFTDEAGDAGRDE